MDDSSILEQARQEIALLQLPVTRYLQRILSPRITVHSRWNGSVGFLSEEESLRAKAHFRLEDGAILISPSLSGEAIRWRTFLHELLHAHSQVKTTHDYDEAIGWEEGPVEFLQRYWRDSIFSELGLAIDPVILEQGDTDWDRTYGSALADLEFLRQELRREENPDVFYATLLTLPVGERYSFLLTQVMPPTTPEKRQGLFALSKVRDRLNNPRPGA